MSAEIFQFPEIAGDFDPKEEQELLKMAQQTGKSVQRFYKDCMDPRTLMTISDGLEGPKRNVTKWLTENC